MATKTPQARRGLARWLTDWAKSIAWALAIWLVLSTFVFRAFRITSGSMENTLLVDDWLFVTKALYGAEIPFTGRHTPALREPRRGEIVVFKSVEGNFDVVKRLVGVPGDTLAMRHGRLVRNGALQVEPYVVRQDSTRSETVEERDRMRRWQVHHLVGDTAGYRPDVQDWGPLVVPADSFFMMGDNRDNSLDSRYWGLVPRGNVRGKPMFVYYSYDGSSWRALPALTAIRWNHLFSRPQ